MHSQGDSVFVFAEDTHDEDLATIKTICIDAFGSQQLSTNLYGDIAKRIRNDLDKKLKNARGWNCVVGRSFGAYLTQKIKCYVYLSVYPGVNILVWKA